MFVFEGWQIKQFHMVDDIWKKYASILTMLFLCFAYSAKIRPCSHHSFGTGTVPERNRAPVFTPVPLRPVVPERADHLAM